MPEYPDIELYLARLRERVVGRRLEGVGLFSPFVLRSVDVPAAELDGRQVTGISRLGKRIVIELADERFVVIHLMIAGRLQWLAPAATPSRPMGRVLLASFRFEHGRLNLVETSSRKRASIAFVRGRDGLDAHRRPGLDLFTCTVDEFAARLRAENRTLKRALTDPLKFDGIGNAYSDEILFAARLSPLRLTRALTDEEASRLLGAAKATLTDWRERLLRMYPDFPRPTDVTAFRSDFATHGKFGKPCPVCGSPIQRIVYAENETNYCATCQNEGRLLADRSLSRLLKSDWPRTLEEMIGG